MNPAYIPILTPNLKISFNFSLPFIPKTSKMSHPFKIPDKAYMFNMPHAVHTSWFIMLILYGEEYK